MAFDAKSQDILKKAIPIFYEKGYDRASIRDIAKQNDISPAAIYYYFKNKEHLLFQIQKRCFEELIKRYRQRETSCETAGEKLKVFVESHLSYFIKNIQEMKILSHEYDSLSGNFRKDIHSIKRVYFNELQDILEAFKQEQQLSHMDPRTLSLCLFGMMNWLYTWYRPGQGNDEESLSKTMLDTFLYGIMHSEVN